MYKLVFRKLMELDEYRAAEISEYNTYEGQRQLSQVRLSRICSVIEDGTFLIGDVALAVLDYDNKRKVQVNGQHQCKAVIKTGIPIHVVYQEYSCATPNDLSLLYRQFDNTPPRSLGDILTPEAAALGIEWKKTIIRLVVSAASLIANHNAPGAHESKIDKVKYLSKYIKQGAFIDFILKDGISCFHMQRAPVAQAMICTWEKDKAAARLFWESVRDGVGLSKDSPALALRNYLMTTGLTKSRTTKTDVATTREMYVKSIHAWNAYRVGAKTSLKYFPDVPVPNIK
jgi:hypothetical protein